MRFRKDAHSTAFLVLVLALATASCGRPQPASRDRPPPQSAEGEPRSTPTTQAPAIPTPGTPTPAPVKQSAGKIEIVLARGVGEAGEPVEPTSEFSETADSIHLILKSGLDSHTSGRVTWTAVQTDAHQSGQEIGAASVSLGAGKSAAASIRAPGGGFPPGNYRVHVAMKEGVELSLAFRVLPLYPPAAPVAEAPPVPGFNIALGALGGKVESVTSEQSQQTWAAANLIDGTERAWSSKESPPQEVVLSFREGRQAQIASVVLDTRTPETLRHPDNLPRHVEVWASATSPSEGFALVAQARLRPVAGLYTIPLAPTTAKYVKLRILASHGGSRTTVGEVRVVESPDGTSILADTPLNLAAPALGGAIVRFTSQQGLGRSASHLVDGSVETEGWQSRGGAFPQDIVFAFRDDRVAQVDRIVINPKSAKPESWAKTFTVSVSAESPLDGFVEVGQFTLEREPRDQAFPIGRPARFVRLRILSNHGGPATGLGEVQLIEGSAQGYRSILVESVAAAQPGAGAGPAAAQQREEPAGDAEAEPNNTPAEANPLEPGRWMRGTVDPLGESDHFLLAVPGTGTRVITFDLQARPFIKTSLALLDAAGKALKRFDPGTVPAGQTALSWAVPPGDYTVQVTEPPISIVLIWDTSGSMGSSIGHLQRAVEATLDQVRPTERLNLIRFDSDMEVLLPGFTSDREGLKAAAAGKFVAKGSTRFYDAVAKGMELLDGVAGNRAIIAMTDGADTSSKLDYPGFWRLLDEKRVRFYTVALGGDLLKAVPAMATTPVRMLAHIAAATNGRAYFVHGGEELTGVYQQIVDELRITSRYALRASLSQGAGGLTVAATGERIAAVSAPSQIALILDASGSMKARIEGRTRIDVARDVMVQIIKELPEEAQVALRVYGHRVREGRPGDCKDSELAVPFGKIDKAKMIARVRAIQALGTTPIAYSLGQIAGDFGKVPGEKMVILVTDGKEECKGDPAAVVAGLLAKGLKVRLNIVGFALADASTKRDMERVARLTGGMFFDAGNAKALTAAIRQALAVPFDVLDAAGTRVGGGLTGQGQVSVPEGIYTVVVRAAGSPITVPRVRVAPDGATRVVLKKEGQEIGVQVLGP